MQSFLHHILFALVATLLLTFGHVSAEDAYGDQERAESRPNVILIVVDTLSARYIGTFGKTPSITPALDQWAATAKVFTQARSTAPWTKPSLASIFTAQYPSVHGVRKLGSELSPKLSLLAERFKEQGYRTAGFVSHTLIAPGTGYERGFERYELVKFRGNVHNSITSDQVTDLGLEFIKAQSDSEPFFLFLHYFDPHFNYQHHKQFDRTSWYKGKLSPGLGFRTIKDRFSKFRLDDVRYLVGLYEEEIAFTDQQIGRLFEGVKAGGKFESTITVFTADHGEEFGEHGSVGHTQTLYDELVRVPLVIGYPKKFTPGVVPHPVSTMDIGPTLEEYLFKRVHGEEQGVQGRSFLSCLESSSECGDATQKARSLFFEVDFKSSRINAYKVGALKENIKYVLDKPTGEEEAYDVVADPLEKNNIIKRGGPSVSKLRAEVAAFRARQPEIETQSDASPEEKKRTPEELKQLKSLGYL